MNKEEVDISSLDDIEKSINKIIQSKNNSYFRNVKYKELFSQTASRVVDVIDSILNSSR